jgi:hypothetical protein
VETKQALVSLLADRKLRIKIWNSGKAGCKFLVLFYWANFC